MASLFSKFSAIRFLYAAISILSISNHHMLVKGDPTLVNNVQTFDAKLCSGILNSDHSAAEAKTPYDLGLASLDLANAKASITRDIIHRAFKRHRPTSDAYKICEMKYNTAISNLKQMKDAYVKHRDMDVRQHSLDVVDAVDDCGDVFSGSRPAYISNNGRYIEILVIVASSVKL